MIGDMVLLLDVLAGEVALFAAVMMLVGGIDDLLVDALLWQCGDAPRPLSTLPAAPPLRYAVFVPAWHEAAVIGAMLEAAASSYDLARLRLYVGCYPNDPATLDAVRTIIPRSPAVRIVVGDRLGPTNKADCLVTLWHAMRADEAAGHARYDAVILHDAEDCIDPAELSVFDHHLRHAAAVQLPVVPLIEPRRHWVSGGYADEFAEAHMRTLVVRQALGASLPLAGVGCALRRDVLERIAAGDGEPFDASSLTEDYELCRDQDKPSYAEQEIISSRTRKHRRNLQKAALKGWIRVRDLGGCNSQRGACRQVHPRCFQSTATSFLEEPSWRRLRL